MTAEGLKAPRWTDDEAKTLARHYPEHGPDWDGWADLLPGRNGNAIRSMAARHGLKSDAIRDLKYTDEETRALRKLYPLHGAAWGGWAEALPLRTYKSISLRARKLGVRKLRRGEQGEQLATSGKWTREQDAYLLYQLAAIARRTGHNAYEVVERANEMQGKVVANG